MSLQRQPAPMASVGLPLTCCLRSLFAPHHCPSGGLLGTTGARWYSGQYLLDGMAAESSLGVGRTLCQRSGIEMAKLLWQRGPLPGLAKEVYGDAKASV